MSNRQDDESTTCMIFIVNKSINRAISWLNCTQSDPIHERTRPMFNSTIQSTGLNVLSILVEYFLSCIRIRFFEWILSTTIAAPILQRVNNHYIRWPHRLMGLTLISLLCCVYYNRHWQMNSSNVTDTELYDYIEPTNDLLTFNFSLTETTTLNSLNRDRGAVVDFRETLFTPTEGKGWHCSKKAWNTPSNNHKSHSMFSVKFEAKNRT